MRAIRGHCKKVIVGEKEEFVAIGDNGNALAEGVSGSRARFRAADPTRAAFFWLSAFFFVYCARPEDFIPGGKYIPLGKITAIMAIYGLFSAMGKTKRTLKDLPKESKILLAMIGILFLGAFLSPVWRHGAIVRTIDFSKIYIVWVLIFLIVTSFDRLRQIISIQVFSVVAVCVIAIVRGHNVPRLEGVMGGFYFNPNDLAFAIVLSLPFALAFLVTAKNPLIKVFWLCAMLAMAATIFLTASRAGFIDLVISFSVALYYFAIKGKRFYLIVATVFIGILVMATAGGKLFDRFAALSGKSSTGDESAYGSYVERKYLMSLAVQAIVHYPVLGIGTRNFPSYSGIWRTVHMTYLQICAEGGIAAMVLYLMFFWRGFVNLRLLHKKKNLDPDFVLFIGALQSSLVGFVVGALFAPEAYQFFPYFAVAFTAALLQTVKEQEQEPGTALPPPKKPRHFLEVYADRETTGTVFSVR